MSGDSGSIVGGWSLTIITTGGTAVIGDSVWNDLDNDGVQDAGEPGLAGWEIYLDTNVNGQWDSGEPKVTTDAGGNYSFTGLAAGNYVVAQVPRLGWNQTYPLSPAAYSITLADGQTRNDLDFGNYELPHQNIPVVASVDGTVQDADVNGVFETLDTAGIYDFAGNSATATIGERRGVFEFNVGSLNYAGAIVGASFNFYIALLGMSSGADMTCSVYAYSGDGTVSLADATAASTLVGSFVAASGAFTVPLDAAVIQSLRGAGNYLGLMVRMPAVQGSYAGIASLEYVFAKPTLNLSALILPPAEVRSSVWNDLDADGIQDAGEPGVAGAGVEIYSSTDSTIGNGDDVLVAQTVTDNAGNYILGNLPSNVNYYLKFRAPVGFTFTTKDAGGDDALDSDADSTGATSLFTLSGGQSDATRDAGLLGVSPSFGYALRLGAAYDDSGESAATDAQGNVYVVGWMGGTSDFDPGPGVYNPPYNGNSGTFVAKYTPTGALLWARRFGAQAYDFCWGQSVALGNDGSVYITGRYEGTVDFDPGPGVFNLTASGNYYDFFVSKLDAEGNFLWARSFGSSTRYDSSNAIAVADDGSVYTTGGFEGSGDFDPGPGTEILTSLGETDIFISKLDSAGNFVWAKRIGGASYDRGAGIDLDGSGNVYTTGYFIGTVDFDPGSGTVNPASYGTYDIFVAKMTPDGNLLWARGMGGSSIDLANGIAVEDDGDVYTTGYFSGRADFDPGTGQALFNSLGGDDAFISKLDANGNFVWVRRIGGSQTEQGLDIDVAGDGSVFTAGTYSGTVDFDPGPGTFQLSNTYRFLTKLDADGNFILASPNGGKSIDVAPDGSVYATGYFWGTSDFDPGPGTFNLASADSYDDIFVSKLLPDHAPTDIALSANSLAENQASGTLIGNFSTQDPDPGEAFTYSLVSGAGSDDNALFTVNSSGQLKTAAILDFETKSAYSIRVRTTDYSGMWFEKVFNITTTDVPEVFAVGAANWTAAGLTLQLGGDGKLHAYQTGTTTDAVPPHNPANVTGIQITGRSGADDELTVDFSAGNPIPAGGLAFDGGSQANGDTLSIRGTAGNDDVILATAQVTVGAAPALGFSGVEFFGFDLGAGADTLLIDHATLRIGRDNAISAGTSVTVDGGVLDFNGKYSTLGDLVLKNNGTALVTAINNTTTTVASGTLTATSIVCDTLTIGTPVMPATRIWDGGGTDNKWSTAANWVGDVAPSPGDNLVFPAGASRLESVDDYPPGTVFGSIELSEEDYVFQNGLVSSTVHVSSGTLTTTSIVCDTLTIGSAANAPLSPTTANSPHAVSMPADNASPPASTDISTDGTAAASASSAAFAMVQHSPLIRVNDSHEDVVPLVKAAWFGPFHLTSRLKDSIFRQNADSSIVMEKNSAVADPIAHNLALRSLARDYEQNSAIDQLDSELLLSKQFHEQNKRRQKAVDEFHADLAGAIKGW